jgi:hypothetical protein
LRLIFEKMKVIVFVSFIGLFATINGDAFDQGDEINAKDWLPSTFGGDGAKKENEKITKNKLEDSQDFSDHLSDKGDHDFDEGHNDHQPISNVSSSVLGKNYVDRKYNCISDNKNYRIIEKIVLKQTLDVTNLNCTQVITSSTCRHFIAYDQDWKKHKMIVCYESYPVREIYINGEITLYHCGDVISGPCKGAVSCEIVHSPNPNPEACFKKPGLTRVDTDFAFLDIKNCGQDFISCSGGGYQTFTPGLRS